MLSKIRTELQLRRLYSKRSGLKIGIATAEVMKEENRVLSVLDEDTADEIAREDANYDKTIATLQADLANVQTRIGLREAEYKEKQE